MFVRQRNQEGNKGDENKLQPLDIVTFGLQKRLRDLLGLHWGGTWRNLSLICRVFDYLTCTGQVLSGFPRGTFFSSSGLAVGCFSGEFSETPEVSRYIPTRLCFSLSLRERNPLLVNTHLPMHASGPLKQSDFSNDATGP